MEAIREQITYDPRTKMFFLLLVNVLVLSFFGPYVALVAGSVVLILLIVDCPSNYVVNYLLVWGGFQLLAIPAYFWPNVFTLFIGYLQFWIARFTVTIGLAAWFIHTTKISEFLASLSAMRMPSFIMIPFSVVLRFIPVVGREMRAVAEAMSLRDLTGWKMAAHPLKFIEMVVVPMLTSLTRAGDDLAAAAIVRGLGRTRTPTPLVRLSFKVTDFLLLLVGVALATVTAMGLI